MTFLASSVLLLALLSTAFKTHRLQIIGLWAQSLVIACITAFLAPWPLVLLVLLIKGILLPGLLFWLTWSVPEEEQGAGSLSLLMVAGGVLWALSRSMHSLPIGTLDHPAFLWPSLSLLLLGMVMTVVRRHVIGQILGLLTIENGIYLLSLGVTSGMPVVIEVGTLMDLGMAGFLFYRLSTWMHHLLGHANVDSLRRLRG